MINIKKKTVLRFLKLYEGAKSKNDWKMHVSERVLSCKTDLVPK